MRSILLVLVSATTLAMTVPAGAQAYLYGMPSGDVGTPSGGRNYDDGRWRSNNWRDGGGDWRQNRNDWRENNVNDWRRNRNEWHDADDWRPRNRRVEDGGRDRVKEDGKDNSKDYVKDNAKNNPYVDERYDAPVPARP